MRKFSRPIDLRSRREMTDYLRNHTLPLVRSKVLAEKSQRKSTIPSGKTRWRFWIRSRKNS